LLKTSFSTPKMTPSRQRTPTAVLHGIAGRWGFEPESATIKGALPSAAQGDAPAVFNRLVGVVNLKELAVGAVRVDRLVIL
jgi:hypothetical protein